MRLGGLRGVGELAGRSHVVMSAYAVKQPGRSARVR